MGCSLLFTDLPVELMIQLGPRFLFLTVIVPKLDHRKLENLLNNHVLWNISQQSFHSGSGFYHKKGRELSASCISGEWLSQYLSRV
uniref:Putative ovule protein n=1 Tax=Solanum chacoense TaxID=4108 RepID=A0A0V0I8Z8_SOLCH